MNIKASLYYIGLIGAAVAVILIVKSIGPGPGPQDGRIDYLPDHITEVTAPTLPRAIREARERGKTMVRITDPMENVIEATVNEPTQTTFRLVGRSHIPGIESLEEALGTLTENDPYIEKARDIQVGEGEVSFVTNHLEHGDVGIIMYELSVRIFRTHSTADWVIDIL